MGLDAILDYNVSGLALNALNEVCCVGKLSSKDCCHRIIWKIMSISFKLGDIK